MVALLLIFTTEFRQDIKSLTRKGQPFLQLGAVETNTVSSIILPLLQDSGVGNMVVEMERIMEVIAGRAQ